MNAPRQPRSKLYDGGIYGRFVDPMLAGVHGFVATHLPEGPRVLEACCGTGSLARRIARDGRTVLGVDLSPRNVEFARGRAGTLESLRFEVADVSTLEVPPEGPHDVATIVLALHEMPADARLPVLRTLLRVARHVMIVDFAVPMPWNVSGMRNRVMELAAGPEHFAAFRDFNRRGGLPALIAGAAATVESDRRIDAGTLQVMVLAGQA